MGSSATLHEIPHADWDDHLGLYGPKDVYFSLGYHLASARLEVDDTVPRLLHHQDDGGEVALPLLLRPLPGRDGYDATSAYGYGGPLASGTPDLDAFGVALDAWAGSTGTVTTFLRFHPLQHTAAAAPPGTDVVPLGPTVTWDLAGDDDLLARAHTNHRRTIRKSRREGVSVAIEESPADLSTFQEIYAQTMTRQGAASFYFFDETYWKALEGELRAELVLVEATVDDELIAGLLCFKGSRWLHYHLGASTERARTLGASTSCFLGAAEWARDRALSAFHLGGGVGGQESSLFTFKQRFDPASAPTPHAVGKLVHDRAAYAELAGSPSTAGFFPPWRSAR